MIQSKEEMMSTVDLCARKSPKWTILPHCNISTTQHCQPEATGDEPRHITQHQESIPHQIYDQSHQFHIYTTHPHFQYSTTLAYSASSIISEAPDLSNSIPIVLTSSLLQKESRFIYILACLIYL